jgi:hypothetical protein
MTFPCSDIWMLDDDVTSAFTTPSSVEQLTLEAQMDKQYGPQTTRFNLRGPVGLWFLYGQIETRISRVADWVPIAARSKVQKCPTQQGHMYNSKSKQAQCNFGLADIGLFSEGNNSSSYYPVLVQSRKARQKQAIQSNTKQYKVIQSNTKQYKAIQSNTKQNQSKAKATTTIQHKPSTRTSRETIESIEQTDLTR